MSTRRSARRTGGQTRSRHKPENRKALDMIVHPAQLASAEEVIE
jgi:hypothetical protein